MAIARRICSLSSFNKSTSSPPRVDCIAAVHKSLLLAAIVCSTAGVVTAVATEAVSVEATTIGAAAAGTGCVQQYSNAASNESGCFVSASVAISTLKPIDVICVRKI